MGLIPTPKTRLWVWGCPPNLCLGSGADPQPHNPPPNLALGVGLPPKSTSGVWGASPASHAPSLLPLGYGADPQTHNLPPNQALGVGLPHNL